MTASPDTPAAVPRLKVGGALLLFALAGIAGNWFKLELFFNCDFLFGSVFVMFALLRYGVAAGVAVSIAASTVSYLHWHHGWAILIFAAETLCAGLLHTRRKWMLLTADIFFWCTGGLVLVWICYHQLMGLPAVPTLVVALKQGVNGVLNTLVATALHLTLRGRAGAGRRPPPSLRTLLFVVMASLVLLPAFGYLCYDIRTLLRQGLEELRGRTARLEAESCTLTSVWLDQNCRTVETLAKLAADDPAATPARLGRYARTVHRSAADFRHLMLLDGRARVIAVSPEAGADPARFLAVSLADHEVIGRSWRSRALEVSDLFPGKLGRPGPRLVVVVPILSAGGTVRGAAAGALDLEKVRGLLSPIAAGRGVTVTVIDRNRRVVATTGTRLQPMQPYQLPKEGSLLGVGGGVEQWIPAQTPGVAAMKRWLASVYLKESAPLPGSGWRVVAEVPLKPTLELIYRKTVVALARIALLMLLIVLVSRLFANGLSGIFRRLEEVTRELPERILSGEAISWPATSSREAEGLVANFQLVASLMRQHVLELGSLNQQLEERVATRTRELSEANDRLTAEIEERQGAQADLAEKQSQLVEINRSLGERIAQAVTDSRQKDQMMIVQGRQAAMGEMIGNIAHQWRQPLNALGLLLANLKDAFQFGELSAEYLDKAVADGNRLVQKMSMTINDFRDFFHPSKECVPFSALKQIREATSLVEPSFRNERVEVLVRAEGDLRLFGFPNEYSQVLLNLLANSKDAIKERKVADGVIEIVLAVTGDGGRVTVRDNGGGIPQESLERIFEPYFSTKQMGTGIGLYMSKMIIERNMHGHLTAKNVPGGAEFTIDTPLWRES